MWQGAGWWLPRRLFLPLPGTPDDPEACEDAGTEGEDCHCDAGHGARPKMPRPSSAAQMPWPIACPTLDVGNGMTKIGRAPIF